MAVQREADAACPHCGVSSDLIAELRVENDALKDEVAKLSVTNKRLRSDQVKSLETDPRYEDATEVLGHWHRVCEPDAREPFSPSRLEPTFARLGTRRGKGYKQRYTVDQLKRCVDGYASRPYVVGGKRQATGNRTQRYTDPSLIFRDDQRVMRGIAYADLADAEAGAFVPTPTPAPSEGPRLSDLGSKALHLAGMGWHVFPCLPNDKRPATRNGLHDATTDLVRIQRYWDRAPEANLAVRTGVESGLVVLDVDGDDGMESLRKLERRFDAVPTTLSVKTPSGGQHFYFEHPGPQIRNSVSVVGVGLDIRGDGGYVLCPPSKVSGRAYAVDESTQVAPLPDWLKKELLEYQTRTARLIQASEWEVLFREAITEGQRNDTVARIAGRYIGKGDSLELTLTQVKALNHTYGKPPLSDKEVQGIVLSIARTHARREAQQ